jgi:hypothetical protein
MPPRPFFFLAGFSSAAGAADFESLEELLSALAAGA